MTIRKRLFWSNILMIVVPMVMTAIVGVLCICMVWLVIRQAPESGLRTAEIFTGPERPPPRLYPQRWTQGRKRAASSLTGWRPYWTPTPCAWWLWRTAAWFILMARAIHHRRGQGAVSAHHPRKGRRYRPAGIAAVPVRKAGSGGLPRHMCPASPGPLFGGPDRGTGPRLSGQGTGAVRRGLPGGDRLR